MDGNDFSKDNAQTQTQKLAPKQISWAHNKQINQFQQKSISYNIHSKNTGTKTNFLWCTVDKIHKTQSIQKQNHIDPQIKKLAPKQISWAHNKQIFQFQQKSISFTHQKTGTKQSFMGSL